MKPVWVSVLFLLSFHLHAQNVESFGIFGGLNFPLTIDEGLTKDPRFFGRFTLRATPIGFSYGYDKVGYGFVTTPSYTQIGQKFIIKNTTGGEVGIREVKMNYASLPVALKLHIMDAAFFRFSLIASMNFSYLVSGKELISHSSSKLRYPISVAIPTDPGYSKVYDGVFVPDVSQQEYVSKDKFNAFQIFAGLGFRTDFDFNENWSLNFDGRANFGIFEPRTDAYIQQLKAPTNAPDLYGQRRDVFVSFCVGVSRIIQTKQTYKPKYSTPIKKGGARGKPRG